MTPIKEQEEAFKEASKVTTGQNIPRSSIVYPPEVAAARERLHRMLAQSNSHDEEPADPAPSIQTNINDSDVFILNAAAIAANNVLIGATYIAEGVTDFTDWVTSMRSCDVNLSDSEMEQLFRESIAFHNDEELPAAEMPFKTMKAKVPVIEKAKAIAANGEELDSRTIYELVVEKMKARAIASPEVNLPDMSELDQIIQEITSDLKPFFPDVIEQVVRCLFSSYGKIINPSQEELSKQVRQLNALLKLALAIVDTQAKIAQLNPGAQRDKATQAVLRQRKELARELRMSGLEYGADSQGS